MIEKVEKYFYGENPKKADINFANIFGLALGGFELLSSYISNTGYSWWQLLILFIIAADTGGGVVSNLTKSTKEFYNKSKTRQYVFLALHFLQPLIIMIVFNLSWTFLLFTFLYMLISSTIVLNISDSKTNLITSVFLTAFGITLAFNFFTTPVFLLWFIPLYFLKLIFGFSSKYVSSYDQNREI